jgi:hypothetical protein
MSVVKHMVLSTALTALGFIMGAIPGASLRFAPGYHLTALSALKARQPASQSSKIGVSSFLQKNQ